MAQSLQARKIALDHQQVIDLLMKLPKPAQENK
jgi:hypothetical protein